MDYCANAYATLHGEAAGFDAGKGKKLSNSHAQAARQAAWQLLSFSSSSPVLNPVTGVLYASTPSQPLSVCLFCYLSEPVSRLNATTLCGRARGSRVRAQWDRNVI